jgi:hypothetical protein
MRYFLGPPSDADLVAPVPLGIRLEVFVLARDINFIGGRQEREVRNREPGTGSAEFAYRAIDRRLLLPINIALTSNYLAGRAKYYTEETRRPIGGIKSSGSIQGDKIVSNPILRSLTLTPAIEAGFLAAGLTVAVMSVIGSLRIVLGV